MAKVCFISPLGAGLYRPELTLPFGGAEAQFYLLSRALADDPAFDVSVLTTVEGEPWSRQQGRLTVIARQARGRRISGAYVAAFVDMLKTLRAIDADVYLHAGAGVEVGAYALICRLLRRRFVYVVASSADLQDSDAVTGPLSRLFPIGVRLAAAVICRSEEQMARLKTRYGRDGVLIRTGYPVAKDAPTSVERNTIVWVGRAHPLKQPQLFLEVAEQLPSVRCEMVLMPDPTHQALMTDCRARAASLANVTFQDGVPWDRIDAVFQRAALYVNTSTYEGFPNTFVQAAMHGVPVVSWRVDPDGILTRHGIGSCAGGSTAVLVEATHRLMTDAAARAAMGRRAQDYACKQHDLTLSVSELKSLLARYIRRRAA